MERGQIGIILGPSGSGKSTMMNIIGGADRLLAGDSVHAGLREQPVRLCRGDNQYVDTHDGEPAVCPDQLRVDLCGVRANQAAMRKEARKNIHERGAESGHGMSCLAATHIKNQY